MNFKNDPYPSFWTDVKALKSQIVDYHNNSQLCRDKKNLEKSFPQFLGEEIVIYAFENDDSDSDINYSLEDDDDIESL